MLRRIAPLLLAGLLIAAARAAAPAAVGEDDVAVDYRNGLYSGSVQVEVAVSAPVAHAVMTDFANMARFIPGLRSSRILEHEGNVFRVAQEGAFEFGPFTLPYHSERRIEIMADGRILSTALSGSSRHMRSELRIQAVTAQTTRLDYRIEMIPAVWIPTSLGINFLRHELAEQFSALSREMERRQRMPRQ